MVSAGEIGLGTDPARPGRQIVRLAKRIGADAANREVCFQAITETAARLLDVERVGIWLYDATHGHVECADMFERGDAKHSRGLSLEAARFPAYFDSLEEERVIAAHDAESDPRTAEFTDSYLRPLGIGAMLDAPIRVGGRMVGVICHEFVGPTREWTVEEQALAASMGDFVSLAIESSERARAQAQHAEMADRLARAHKMDALGRLAGSLAHDFNNLLTAIYGSLELVRLAQRRNRLDDALLTEELGQIEKASDRAGCLVRRLLGFSHHEVVEPRVMDAADALNGLRDRLVRLVGDAITLDLEVDPDTPCIRFDPSQFEDVVLALASNARDAMPQGGELKIHMRELRAQDAVEWTELLVSDGGAGIPPEVLPLIFEPFYSTKSMGTGWGLGLATVQRLVESAGGHIFVRSRPQEGTSFRVRLPAVQVAEQAPAAATILVCEDESRVLAMLEQTLEEAGYKVLAARDPTHARAVVRDHEGPIDLLLSDVIMPGASGPVLAGEFSAQHPDMRVLYVSGYSAGELRRNGVSVEGHRLMAKPFKPADVLRHVRDELVRARGRGTTR